MMAVERVWCRYCGREIATNFFGTWLHEWSKSVWCDASATQKARP